jgi:O-antigen/teichoic acid export membrane protein
MLKKFLKDGAIYSISNLLSRGISIFLIPFYTRVLSPSDYGIIDILTIITTLINLTIAFEITQGIARYLPDSTNLRDKIGYSSTALWFTLVVYSIFALLTYAWSVPLSRWVLNADGLTDIFQIAILSIWTNGIYYFLQNQLRWQLKSKQYAVIGIIVTAISATTTIFMLVGMGLGIIGVFCGLIAGNLTGIVLSYYYGRENIRLFFDFRKLKEMLSFSIPLVPSSIGVFIALYIDRLAIKELMTLKDVGLYAIGYKFASIVGLLMVGFQGALTPLIYQHYRDLNTPLELAHIFRYFITGALVFLLGLSLFSKEIIMLFTTPEYYGGYTVIPILVPAVLLSGMYIFAPGLAIAKKTKTIAFINICAALINTVLNFLLIPIWGINGSAFATFISAFVSFLLYLIMSNRYYPIPYKWKKVIKCVIYITFLLLIIRFIDIGYMWGIFVKFIFTIISIVIIVLTLIDVKEINLFFKKKFDRVTNKL